MPVEDLAQLPIMATARRLKSALRSDQIVELRKFGDQITQAFDQIRVEYGAVPEKSA